MGLRGYQAKLSADVIEALNKYRSVLATCPTGGGKTHLISHHAKLAGGLNLIQAHRQELVYQISMALARDGAYHRIIAPDAVCRYIVERQIRDSGRNWIDYRAQTLVASVDTLIARADQFNWLAHINLIQTDEGHHCLPDNKWGRVLNLFPNAKVLAWTATAGRADRKPLAGCFEVLVEGPTVRELLDQGHLCPYRIYGPPPSIDVSAVPESASGDYSPTALRSAAHKSTVTGDMVTHYRKLTPGAVGIAFLVDVDQAKETAERFNAAGIPAVWMSSRETDDRTRVGNLEALARGDLKLICNVDLLGEGVDVPRVEVVLDGRPTKSLPRYLQVFGRLLRNFPGKTTGTYIDLVGNVIEHGLPDAPRVWSLDGGTKRKRLENDEAGLTACLECYWLRPRYKPVCPNCGHRPKPAGRERPEQVDGDLTEYGPELLARLGKAADAIMMPAPDGAAKYVRDNWEVRAMMQTQLRAAMAQWAGTHREVYGRSDSELYRLFWHRFGIDTLSAQNLGRSQAAELHDKIWEDIKNVCTRPRPPAQVIVPDEQEVFRLSRGQTKGIIPCQDKGGQNKK